MKIFSYMDTYMRGIYMSYIYGAISLRTNIVSL